MLQIHENTQKNIKKNCREWICCCSTGQQMDGHVGSSSMFFVFLFWKASHVKYRHCSYNMSEIKCHTHNPDTYTQTHTVEDTWCIHGYTSVQSYRDTHVSHRIMLLSPRLTFQNMLFFTEQRCHGQPDICPSHLSMLLMRTHTGLDTWCSYCIIPLSLWLALCSEITPWISMSLHSHHFFL